MSLNDPNQVNLHRHQHPIKQIWQLEVPADSNGIITRYFSVSICRWYCERMWRRGLHSDIVEVESWTIDVEPKRYGAGAQTIDYMLVNIVWIKAAKPKWVTYILSVSLSSVRRSNLTAMARVNSPRPGIKYSTESLNRDRHKLRHNRTIVFKSVY